MRVTELLMSNADNFSFVLDGQTAPTAVIDKAVASVRDLDGFVVAFDTPVYSDPTLDAARFTGRLMQRDGFSGFSGSGLASFLQTTSNIGRHIDPDNLGALESGGLAASRTAEDWVDILLTGTDDFAGLSKGTVNLSGVSSTSLAWPFDLGGIEQLNAVCASTGSAWRIDPDGSIHIAARENLFVSDPEVIVLDEPTSELSGGGVRGVNGSISGYREDSSQKSAVTYGAGAGLGADIEFATSSTTTVAYGLDGSPVTLARTLDASNVDDSTELAGLVNANAARFTDVRRSFRVDIASRGFRSRVRPGDEIYVWSQLYDITGADTVAWMGQALNPARATVNRIEWGVHADQGVWLYRPADSDPWTRLTEYLVLGDPGASLQVSDGATSADISEIVGPKRYETRAPTSPVPRDVNR